MEFQGQVFPTKLENYMGSFIFWHLFFLGSFSNDINFFSGTSRGSFYDYLTTYQSLPQTLKILRGQHTKISSKLRNFCFWRFYLFSIISSSKYGLVALEMVSGSWSDKTIDLRLDLPDLDSYRNLTSSSSDDATLRAAANFNFFDRSSDFRVKLNLFLILKGFFEGIFWVSKVGRGRIHHQLNIISHIFFDH